MFYRCNLHIDSVDLEKLAGFFSYLFVINVMVLSVAQVIYT